MKKILVDNWSFEEFVDEARSRDIVSQKRYSSGFCDLLEILVLADEVYYPEYDKPEWWRKFSEGMGLNSLVHPFSVNENDYKDAIYACFVNLFGLGKNMDNVSEGAIKYTIISDYNGFRYFPCQKRNEFLQKYAIKKDMGVPDRMDFLRGFSKKMEAKCRETNAFLGMDFYKIPYPALAHYIISTSAKDKSPIQTAIELREEKMVKDYRKYMQKVEDAINRGEKDKLNILVEDMSDIINRHEYLGVTVFFDIYGFSEKK